MQERTSQQPVQGASSWFDVSRSIVPGERESAPRPKRTHTGREGEVVSMKARQSGCMELLHCFCVYCGILRVEHNIMLNLNGGSRKGLSLVRKNYKLSLCIIKRQSITMAARYRA
jgi:hypothetical protein